MGAVLILVVTVAAIGLFWVLNGSGAFEALPLLLLLGGVSLVSYMVVRRNLDSAWARTAAVLAPVAVLGWAAWRPALSARKLWVTQRAYKAMASVTWLSLLAAALTLPANGFSLTVWATRGWPWLALAVVAWVVGRGVRELEVRSGMRNLELYQENLARLD